MDLLCDLSAPPGVNLKGGRPDLLPHANVSSRIIREPISFTLNCFDLSLNTGINCLEASNVFFINMTKLDSFVEDKTFSLEALNKRYYLLAACHQGST